MGLGKMKNNSMSSFFIVQAIIFTMAAISAPFIGCGERPSEWYEPPQAVNEDLIQSENAGPGHWTPPSDGQCLSDADCQALGPWRSCQSSRCEIDAHSKTLLLHTLSVSTPQMLHPILGESLSQLAQMGQLNILIHLSEDGGWIIQGVPSGDVAGETTFGQSDRFGAHYGRSEMTCESGICENIFQPDSNGERLLLYVRDLETPDQVGQCAFQPLELSDVRLAIWVDLGATSEDNVEQPHVQVLIDGVLPANIARNFVMNSGESLFELLRRQDMEMNWKADRGDEGGWQVSIIADADEVLFDNDPGSVIEAEPDHPSRGNLRNDQFCP